MTRTVHFYGAKGGAGASTIAALFAIEQRNAGTTVELADGAGDHSDLACLLGIPSTGDPIYLEGILDGPDDTVHVVDHGTTPPASRESGDPVFLVMRSDYLSLRRALAGGYRPDGIIFVSEKDRALGERDIVDVLGVRVVATLPHDISLARYADAGLLSHRGFRFSKPLLPLLLPVPVGA